MHTDSDLDAVAIAETLWLVASAPPGPDTSGSRHRNQEATSGQIRQDDVETHSAPAPGNSPAPSSPTAGLPAHAVQMRGNRALPRARELARALQPLKQPWRQGRTRQLDIDATITEYERTAELVPVFRPAAERWFELTLVVDYSASMAIWQEVVDEFTRVLRNLGAFRKLTVWVLHADAIEPCLQRLGSRGSVRLTFATLGPSQARRLTLIVSDCTGRAWRDGRMWAQVHNWARAAPTALINPLPARIWRHIGVDLPATRAGAPLVPGSKNPGFRLAEHLVGDAAECLAVPMLTLSPRSLGQWARVLMRGSPEGCDALLVPRRENQYEAADPPMEVSGIPVAEGFRYLASAAAVRLAALCSPFPSFNLEMVRFIANVLVPEATTADIAEFVVAGPLAVFDAGQDSSAVFLFREDAVADLQAMLGTRDAWRLHDALVAGGNPTDEQSNRAYARVGVPEGNWTGLDGRQSLSDAVAHVLRALAPRHNNPSLSAAPRSTTALELPGLGELDDAELRTIIANARVILFDFDGPICRLFAGHSAERMAQDLVSWLDNQGLRGLLNESERRARDPLVILRAVFRRYPSSSLVREMEERITQMEIAAVSSSMPTAYADPVIHSWVAVGARLAVVTNTSPRAVKVYLESRGLFSLFGGRIYGRTSDVTLLKPNPSVILRALAAMGASSREALVIGDTPSDVYASEQAGVPFVGYARNEYKQRILRESGARIIINSLEPLLIALRSGE